MAGVRVEGDVGNMCFSIYGICGITSSSYENDHDCHNCQLISTFGILSLKTEVETPLGG